MSDFFSSGPNPNMTDPGGHKANHDVKAQKYHTQGFPGFWSEVINLLIVVGIIAVIFVLIRIF